MTRTANKDVKLLKIVLHLLLSQEMSRKTATYTEAVLTPMDLAKKTQYVTLATTVISYKMIYFPLV